MAKEADYTYTYSADATILINDKSSGKRYYTGKLTDNAPMLVPEQTVVTQMPRKDLYVTQSLSIDYGAYNARAREIVRNLKIDSVSTCTLLVEMNIYVKGSSEELAQDKQNMYTFSLSMPLNQDTVSFNRSSDVSNGTSNLLTVRKSVARVVMLVLAIVFASLTFLFAVAYVGFIFITRNTDINYTRKLQKILSNYQSYIQKIANPFNKEGYQPLEVKSFVDLLEIRDTIQSPILMYENEDQTCTTFMIPTNTKLLYIFEIKVEDYDELYGYAQTIEANTLLDLGGDEELHILEDVDVDELVDALEQPDIPLSELTYDEDEAVETESEEGVDVVGVAYPMRRKIYHYDVNGEFMDTGDIILVPDKDEKLNKDVIRKATVAHQNKKVEPESVESPLQKVIGIFKRKAEAALLPKEDTETFATVNPVQNEVPVQAKETVTTENE